LNIILIVKHYIGDWGLGIGDWGLAQSPIPNPQSPIFQNKQFLKLPII